MADINHEIKINATPQTIYQALTNTSELAKWHTADVDGKGGTFTTHPSHGPNFEWRVLKPDSQTVEWQCIAGPGHSVGTVAQFKLSPSEGGRTLVELSHTGWPDTSGNFRKCNTLWGILLFHLKQYLDAGRATPAFN